MAQQHGFYWNAGTSAHVAQGACKITELVRSSAAGKKSRLSSLPLETVQSGALSCKVQHIPPFLDSHFGPEIWLYFASRSFKGA
jgi:hypothetical protein